MVQVTDDTLLVLNDIAKLAIRYHAQYKDADKLDLIDRLEQHYAYGTLDWLYRKDEIVAAVIYNIINEGRVANILDMVIKPSENSIKIMKYFIARGWMRFPSLQFIRFERAFKDKKGYRMYRMKRFFNKKENK